MKTIKAIDSKANFIKSISERIPAISARKNCTTMNYTTPSAYANSNRLGSTVASSSISK